MKTLLPISPDDDSYAVHNSVCNMIVRIAQLARQRPSPLDMKVAPESVGIIAAFDKFYNGDLTAWELASKLNDLFDG